MVYESLCLRVRLASRAVPTSQRGHLEHESNRHVATHLSRAHTILSRGDLIGCLFIYLFIYLFMTIVTFSNSAAWSCIWYSLMFMV